MPPAPAAEVAHFLLELRNQVKLHHWQTKVYARHVATDGAVDALDKTIDRFVEVFIAKYGRPKVVGATACVALHNLTEKGIVRYIKATIEKLQRAGHSGPLKTVKAADTDLLNMRDELVAELNKLLYLFTLH